MLFVCVHNSGRSQMAEAFFNRLARGKYSAASAGTEPSPGLNLTVVRVMAEAGIDLSNHKPKLLTPEMVKEARRVITMGCGVAASCPALFTPTEDWGLTDTQCAPEAIVRQIRDKIKGRIEKLIRELDRDLTHS